jgi:NitT/TauT family transport system permease protein
MRIPRIFLGLVAILLALEVANVLFAPPAYVFSPPSNSLALVASSPGRFAPAWLYTVGNAAAGFVLAASLAAGLLALAYAMARQGRFVSALVDTLQSFPKETLFPIFVLWLGFGPQTKIVNAALLSFIPLFVSAYSPLMFPRRDYQAFYQTFGASNRWRELRVLRLPLAIPGIYAGLRLAIPLALVGSVLGEFLGGGEGLGHVILMGSLAFRIDHSFAAVYLLAITGVLALEIVDAIFLVGLKRFFDTDFVKREGV